MMNDHKLSPKSSSLHRTITDFSGVGIAVLGRDSILCCNEYFRRSTGLTGKGSTVNDFLRRIRPGDRNAFSRHLEALFTGRKRYVRFDLRVDGEDGSRGFRVSAHRMEYAGRPVVHLIFDEMTGRKKLLRETGVDDDMRLYHDDRLAALGAMAAGIAHELNQPLNTIRVVTDGYLFGREAGWPLDREELFENLEMVSRQVMRMEKVIRNVRNFSREENEQSIENVNANEAIANVFSMIGRQIEAHGIRVEKDLDPLLPPIRASLNELEQVVMNLIVNARQALDDSSRTPKILRIRTGVRDGLVFIEVSDNGAGIVEPLLGKIFDPFFTTKAVGKGTGLGLSISQSIVGKFGGRIDVSNNESGGATFVVSLPAGGERP